MAYSNPTGTNISSIVDVMRYVNDITTVGGVGIIGIGILLVVGFVAFLSTKDYSNERAFGFASFITMITGLFLRFLHMINDWIFAITILLFVGSVILLMRERNVEEAGA